MNLKNGYKQTKVGIIPNDWEVKELRELGKFSKGKGILKDQVKEKGFPCIRYGEIYTTHDYIIKEFKSFIDEETARESQEIKKGNILFAGSGETVEEIGKSVAFIGDEKAFAGGDVIILSVTENTNSECLSYILETDVVRKQKRRLGQGNSVVHIYPSSLAAIKLPLPPLPEQKKIAQILSIWDSAIEMTEKLLTAKQTRKRALMQCLLTGKQRFPQFAGQAFEAKEIQEFVELRNIKFDPKNNAEILPCIELEHLSQESGRLLGFVNSNEKISLKNRFQANDVLFGKLRPYLRKYFQPNFEGVCTTEIWVLRAKENCCDFRFLFHLVQSERFIQVANATSGSKMPRADWHWISEFPMFLPSLEEQKRIAEVLSACDKEINLLQKQREALKDQKRGLMQILLTGKVRVKVGAVGAMEA